MTVYVGRLLHKSRSSLMEAGEGAPYAVSVSTLYHAPYTNGSDGGGHLGNRKRCDG